MKKNNMKVEEVKRIAEKELFIKRVKVEIERNFYVNIKNILTFESKSEILDFLNKEFFDKEFSEKNIKDSAYHIRETKNYIIYNRIKLIKNKQGYMKKLVLKNILSFSLQRCILKKEVKKTLI